MELALRALPWGRYRPNPLVGAVLVYEGRILGEGWHQAYGQAHAEVNALAAVGPEDRDKIPHSTLYVSLEPCFHYGKTPPCVDLVLRERIPCVVIGMADPFPAVAGQSIRKLQEAGVEVVLAPNPADFEQLNRRFLSVHLAQRPYVVLKCALSADGYIGRPEEEIALTQPETRYWTHRWRSEEAAILVGTNTALCDDPRLDNRAFGAYTVQPLRLVLDRHKRLPDSLDLFKRAAEQPTWVLVEDLPQEPPAQGLRYMALDFGRMPQALVELLQKERISSLLVEGGGQVLQGFLQAQIWDEMRILRSAKSLGQGLPSPQLPQGARLAHSAKLPSGDQLEIWLPPTPNSNILCLAI